MTGSILPKIFRLVLICIALVFGYGLSAIKVSAQILDSKAHPVTDATIIDGYKRVFTNSNGYFSIITGSDSLIVSKLGYEQQILDVKDIPQQIFLIAKPIILNPVRVIEHYDPGSGALDKTVLISDSDGSNSALSNPLLRESSITTNSVKLLGESQTLSLIGNLSRHTLIMLDNVALNAHGEAFDISTLPWSAIKRIEIIKGNASLYGGASAIGGIVYLYTTDTKDPIPVKLTREVAYGSFGSRTRLLVYEQNSSNLNFRISVSKQSAENNFHYKTRSWWPVSGELTRENNSKKQQNIAFKLDSSVKNINWVYNLESDQFRKELPGPVNSLDIYKNAYLTGQNYRQNLSMNNNMGKMANSLVLWQNEDNTGYDNTRAPNPVYSTLYRQQQTSIGVKGQSKYHCNPVDVSLGLELSRQGYERIDKLIPAASIKEKRMQQAALYLNALRETDRLFLNNTLQAGIRMDEVTDFGNHTSWRIEDMVRSDGEIELQAGVTLGSSFSLPSFYDLYWKGDSQSLGNPDLEPETSFGGSLWASTAYQNYYIKAAYYRNEIKKLIQWRQTYLFGTQWKPVNIGKASINNLELNLKTQPVQWLALNSSVTFTQAKDITNGNDYYLTYTPDIKWTAEAIHTHKDFTFVLNFDYTGRQWTTPDNLLNSQSIPDVTLIGTTFKYKLLCKKLRLDFDVQLHNLFDRHYEIYAYVPQPGFNWSAGINLTYSM